MTDDHMKALTEIGRLNDVCNEIRASWQADRVRLAAALNANAALSAALNDAHGHVCECGDYAFATEIRNIIKAHGVVRVKP